MARPQRPASKETQANIAAIVDESAEWADAHGYPEAAQDFRGRAARYRAGNEQPQDAGQAPG